MGIPAYKKRKVSSSSTHGYASDRIPTDDASDESSTKESKAIAARPVAPSKAVPRGQATTARSSIANRAYSSGLLQLQIEELLVKVRPDYERRMLKAENALRKLKHIIERIPNREAKPILEAEREQQQSHTVEIPFPKSPPGKDARYMFAYSRPANVNVVGSYARRTSIQVGDQLVIDLAVSMPSHIFQEKDYLNYRYFHKRAFYLACIATGIEEAENCSFAIKFAFQNDNELLPVILVSPGQGSDDFTKSRCLIRIILAADGDLFPIAKTLPNKNCVRSNAGATASQTISNTATPFYNASLRSECSTLAYLKYLHEASTQSIGFADACVLGSVWLRQRSLGRGGFGPFEWACTMALLMEGVRPKRRPVLSKGYSSYQLFKATLQYLAMTNLVATPVFIQSVSTDIVNLDNPVLFDGVNGLNVLFKMTPWSYANLRHEASGTLKLLSDPLSEHFDACFITRVNEPLQIFDCVLNVPVFAPRTTSPQETDAANDDVTYCRQLYEALKSGLGDRVAMMYLEMPVKLPWLPGVSRSAQTNQDHVQVGLLLNPEQINRTVDRGPYAEDKEAATAFRTFWGKKAELRRFKDGSIRESLVWSGSDPQNSVLKQIVSYVVQRNMGEEAAAGLELVGDSFNRLLPSHEGAPSHPFAVYQPIMSAFEVLEKDLRGLEGLPLHIRQISSADPQLRYASFTAPILDSVQCKMDPANMCIQFEGSSRWPDDLTAVQKTKIAFLLKIGELLEESVTGVDTRVGLENTDSCLLNSSFLDILYPSGALFRIRTHYEREPNLLDQILKGEAHTAASREEIASALSVYRRCFIQGPLHTQAVRTLSTRFPLLSPSMRLVKKWRDSHLLSGHISDELIELLTIRGFVHPHPWSMPGSVMTAFLRTLIFISKWDWWSEPLFVDFNGEMNAQDINNINLRFGAWRKADPAMNRMAIFAASNVDREGTTWTEAGPLKVVAARFKSLAKAACTLVKKQGMNVEPEVLFAHSMEDYDFVIHLNQKFVGNKQLQVEAFEGKRLVGFNPVKPFINELRTIYGSNVLFFHDECGGSVIAGVWNPQTGPRPWNVNLSYNTMPVSQIKDTDGEAEISINKDAILHDIARLGDDMISRIDAKR